MLEGYGGLWWGLVSRTITMPLTSSSIESKLPSWSDLGLRGPLVAIISRKITMPGGSYQTNNMGIHCFVKQLS